MNLTTFNTSRMYTREGQVITAGFDPATSMVYFNDHSRMVSGAFQTEFPTADPATDDLHHFIRSVMYKYDRGGFDYHNLTAMNLRRQDTVHIGRF